MIPLVRIFHFLIIPLAMLAMIPTYNLLYGYIYTVEYVYYELSKDLKLCS